MAPTIPDTAYAILRALFARGGPVSDSGKRRVVGTAEIREAIGKDPHPVLGRNVIGRGWARKWEGTTELHGYAFAKDRIAGVVLTELGQAAFELGRRELGEDLPEQVGFPVERAGMARFMD